MINDPDRLVINKTRQWLDDIVIGLNFCPFAKKPFNEDSINYIVDNSDSIESALEEVINQCRLLDSNQGETTLIIYTHGLLADFFSYLDYLDLANQLMIAQGYEGIYQLASFHPDYCFDGLKQEAAENFTNRSPYPMLHIIREKSLEKALEHYPDAQQIPEKNIELAKQKGYRFFLDYLDNLKK